jgi:uncharacterized protein (TIGR03086 family)
MPDKTALLERALRTMRGLADQVAPGDLGRPTPCEEYDVGGLLAHVIGWQRVFGACAAGHEPPVVAGSPAYVLSPDPAGDLRVAAAALVENLRHRTDPAITVPYRGTTSVAVLVDELLAETVIHAWDLATGLRRTVEFDDELVAAAHVGLSRLLGESFAERAFLPPPPSATARDELERLLVRSGRSVPGAGAR